MEDLRYAKQMYLKEEIIDKGFDAGQFTMYCNTLKGIDIDNYTFDELEEIVNNFQSLVVRNQRRKTRDDVEEKKPIVEVVEKTTRSQSVESGEVYRESRSVSVAGKSKGGKYVVNGVQVMDNSLSNCGIVNVKVLP